LMSLAPFMWGGMMKALVGFLVLEMDILISVSCDVTVICII